MSQEIGRAEITSLHSSLHMELLYDFFVSEQYLQLRLHFVPLILSNIVLGSNSLCEQTSMCMLPLFYKILTELLIFDTVLLLEIYKYAIFDLISSLYALSKALA